MAPARFIKTLQDLAASSMVLASEDVLYHRDYFNKLENDSIVGRLHKKNPSGGYAQFYVEPEIALPKVAAGGFAYHVELATAYPIMSKIFDEDTLCNLDQIELYHLQQMHQPLQKGSEFREMLDYILHKMDEYGVLHRQLKHWHTKRPQCIRSRPATMSVTIDEFYPALSLLFGGIVFSLIVLILENVVHLRQIKVEEEKMRKMLRTNKNYGMIKRVTPLIKNGDS
ncbi:uncharacterized protein [Atheta coriaria]|uniref:uncharacterized protein n=1 Tax=Dalotia coriaria TaxID=877792 RepID=UPI0031F358EA